MSAAALVKLTLFLKNNGDKVLYVLIGIFAFLFLLMTMILGNQSAQRESAHNSVVGEARVNPEVEELRPVFEQYAEQYGIPDQVDILMAKTQQETGGKLPDVMQSSESAGLPMNTIDNKEKSIEQGTKYWAQVLEQAGGDVELSLQSYNFGRGFIDYVKDNHSGEYSEEAAIEFSKSQYEKLKHTGLYQCNNADKIATGACYGDYKYVEKVLANINTPVDVGDFDVEVVEVGTQWIGNSDYVFGGGRTRAEQEQGEFDCSSFVHWAFEQVGTDLGNLASTNTDTLKVQGEDVDYEDAQPGDMVFFDTYKLDGHIGIYLGDGEFIGAQSSTGVAIESMEEGYWADTFNGRVKRM